MVQNLRKIKGLWIFSIKREGKNTGCLVVRAEAPALAKPDISPHKFEICLPNRL
jgi:hypothetical protein